MARNDTTKTSAQEAAEIAIPEDARGDFDDGQENNKALAVISGTMALGEIAGDDGGDSGADIQLPRLQIAYGVGQFADAYNPGDLILAKDTVLVKKGEPIRLILLSVYVYWKEYMTPEKRAEKRDSKVFLTKKEVLDANETIDWVNGVGPTFSRACNLKMFIEKPDGLESGLFGIDIGSKVYAPALVDFDKTAFRRVYPIIKTAAKFSLRNRGLTSGIFELKTRTEPVNGNATVVPNLRLAGHLTDEELTQLRALVTGSSEAEGLVDKAD